MAICSLGAGISIARRYFSETKLVLAATVGISGILLYLAAGAIYLLGISWQWGYAITAICLIALLCETKELRRWWRDPTTRQMLLGWLFLELWILLANLEIRHFAIWIGDWQEHYDRALFFLQHWPAAAKVYGDYAIPARPPMMNLIEALFLGQVGSSYEFFQTAAAFFNTVIYLPIAALAVDWGGKNVPRLIAALLALSPWFVQNATYPWTKLYSTFYALLGIWFYWRFLRDETEFSVQRSAFSIFSLLMLAAGCIVHYSVAVVAVYIALHDLVFHRQQWRRIVITWAICALLMLTWVGWSVATYGLHGTTGSTTTVIEAERNSTASLLKNFGLNAAYSLVPRTILRPSLTMEMLRSPEWFWSKCHDVGFLIYEPSLLLSLGTGGSVAMIWLLFRKQKTAHKKFWIVMFVWIYLGGLLVCTPPSYYLGGVAHVILQPVVWIALAWLAAQSARMPRWLRRTWWIGVFIDACWLMLHLGLEGRVFTFIHTASGDYPADPLTAGRATLANQMFQFRRGLRFLGMETLPWEPLVLTLLVCCTLGWWLWLQRELSLTQRHAAAKLRDVP
ncbi:MAG TPA: hypothetical protein VGG19_16725 [Tepidisphaeraceae bacterium]